jgi:hypothetical protein
MRCEKLDMKMLLSHRRREATAQQARRAVVTPRPGAVRVPCGGGRWLVGASAIGDTEIRRHELVLDIRWINAA